VETFLWRERCGNGLTHRVCHGERSISRTRRVPRGHARGTAIQSEQVRQLVKGIWDGLSPKLSEVAALREVRPLTEVRIFDIDAARKYLESKDVRFDGDTYEIEGMVKLCTFYDPDGNSWAVQEKPTE